MAKPIIGRNRANVLTGAPDVKAAGGALVGPVATDPSLFPMDATTALNTKLGMWPAGYISEDGVTKTTERSTDKIKDWNGDTVLITQSDHAVNLKLTFYEAANARLLKTLFGPGNVRIADGGNKISVLNNADELEHVALDFEIKAGKGKRIRLFAPDAQATSVGDVQFVRSGIVKYEVTFECFPDVNDNKLYEFIDRMDAAAEDFSRKITLPASTSSGEWTLMVDGVTLTGLAHNVQGSMIKTKLAEAGLKNVDVAGNGPYTFTNVLDVSADKATLKGGSGDIKIEPVEAA